MIVDSSAADIVYSNLFTGVHGNYLKGSIVAQGMDPANLPHRSDQHEFRRHAKAKAWKEIWGCGQGIGAVQAVVPAAALIERLTREYEQARAELHAA